MKATNKPLFLSIVFLFSAVITLCFHSHLLISDNGLNSLSPDGIKNLYTPAYYILYDKDYSWFEGMNYPYGEHVVFTDNQPLISNTLKAIHKITPFSINNIIFILYLLVLLSFPICSMFVFLILKHYQIPDIFSAIASICITFLSPQILRLEGHYSLAYLFVIPALWYALICWGRRRSILRSLLISLLIICLTLIHVYYLPICALFVVLWFWAEKKIQWQNILHLIIQIIPAFLILKSWLFLTDPIIDRPDSPTGFFSNTSAWEGLFLPIEFPHGEWLNSIIKIRNVGWEGRSYLGFPALVAGLIWLIGSAVFLWKRIFSQNDSNVEFISTGYRYIMVCLITLLISYGFPFNMGFENILEHVPFVKQFRSLGRFTWIIYFVFNIMVFKWLWSVSHKSIVKQIGVYMLLLIMILEAWHFNYKLHSEKENRSTETQYFSEEIFSTLQDYQCIISLPYFHIGSEVLGTEIDEHLMNNSLILSMQTGIPLVGVNMSRTSYNQTLSQLQLFKLPIKESPILTNYDQRDILVYKNKDDEREEFKVFLNNSKKIWHNQDFELYSTSVKSIQNNQIIIKDSINTLKTESLVNELKLTRIDGLDSISVYNGILKSNKTAVWTISFSADISNPISPTTGMFINVYDENNNLLDHDLKLWGEMIRSIDGEKALMEYEIPVEFELGKLEVWFELVHPMKEINIKNFLITQPNKI